MSDNDRMERAKRIRQMREGQRDDDEESSPDGETTMDATADEADDDEADDDGAEGEDEDDPTPEEVVENVAGTRASLPSTEEMEAAMERTMEQADAVDEAGDAGTGGADAVESTAAPDVDADPDADPDADGAAEGEAAGPAGIAGQSTTREAKTRVLEFSLAGERYCLDIEYIEEIVKQETITRVPNTPEFVEGVVDLRGQITTILNPKVAIGKDDRSAGELVVVFDAEAFDDQGAIGWVVDDVRQVSPVHEEQVNDPPLGEDYINGVIDREDDDEFVIWTTPDLALEEAE